MSADNFHDFFFCLRETDEVNVRVFYGAHNTHSCIGQARAGGAYERAVSSSPLAGVPGSGRQRIRPAPTTHGHGHQAPSRERKAACPLVRAERSEGPQAGASLARPYVPATTSNGYVCVCVLPHSDEAGLASILFCTYSRLVWLPGFASWCRPISIAASPSAGRESARLHPSSPPGSCPSPPARREQRRVSFFFLSVYDNARRRSLSSVARVLAFISRRLFCLLWCSSRLSVHTTQKYADYIHGCNRNTSKALILRLATASDLRDARKLSLLLLRQRGISHLRRNIYFVQSSSIGRWLFRLVV
jgi:hypothetical protein